MSVSGAMTTTLTQRDNVSTESIVQYGYTDPHHRQPAAAARDGVFAMVVSLIRDGVVCRMNRLQTCDGGPRAPHFCSQDRVSRVSRVSREDSFQRAWRSRPRENDGDWGVGGSWKKFLIVLTDEWTPTQLDHHPSQDDALL